MADFFQSFCTKELARIRASSLFLTIRNYENEYAEVSDFSIVFHVDYLRSVKKSQQIISAYRPNFIDCSGKKFSIKDLELAQKELLDSYAMTLAGYNPLYTCIGVYDQVVDADGKVIPGIKLHKRDDILHLEGYRIHKRIHRPGNYPVTHSLPLTIAKNFLRAKTPVDRWGQFKLTLGKFSSIVVDRITITHHDVIREAW